MSHETQQNQEPQTPRTSSLIRSRVGTHRIPGPKDITEADVSQAQRTLATNRAYIERLGAQSDHQTQAEARRQYTSIKATIAKFALATAVVATGLLGLKLITDKSATGKGAEARAELLAVLPQETQLSKKDLTDLSCIVSRAARACQNVVGVDRFEAENCDTQALDAMSKSKGPNMAIAGYSEGAKRVAAPAGIEPTLLCEGGSSPKLAISANRIPGKFPSKVDAE